MTGTGSCGEPDALQTPLKEQEGDLGTRSPQKLRGSGVTAQAVSFTAGWESSQVPLKKRAFTAMSEGLQEPLKFMPKSINLMPLGYRCFLLYP